MFTRATNMLTNERCFVANSAKTRCASERGKHCSKSDTGVRNTNFQGRAQPPESMNDNRLLYTNVNVEEEKKCVSDVNKSHARTSVNDMLRGPIKLRLPRNKSKKKKRAEITEKKFKGEQLRSPHSTNNNKKNWARKPATKKKKLVALVNKLTVNKCGRTARAALEAEGPMACAAALPGGS